MSPIYKSFFTIWPSVSISLPLFSFFSHSSLSLSLCKVQAYIISPKGSLINSEPLHPNSLSYIPRTERVFPLHQHVNEGGSIALETPGAHKIGDWRLGC